MSILDEGIARLREALARAPAEQRQAIKEMIETLLMASRAASAAYPVDLPPCLQTLTEEQLAAVNDLTNRAVLHVMQEMTIKIGIEIAQGAAAAAKRH